jgi:hypothetical protein
VPDLFTKEVLARITPTDRALFRRASRACRAAVESSRLARAGRYVDFETYQAEGSLLFEASNFVASVELSLYAVVNGCGWPQIARAVRGTEAAEAAAAEQAAVAITEAEVRAAKEAAAAERDAEELSECVEAALILINALDVDAAGVPLELVARDVNCRFSRRVVYLAVDELCKDGHIYAAHNAVEGESFNTENIMFKVSYGDDMLTEPTD